MSLLCHVKNGLPPKFYLFIDGPVVKIRPMMNGVEGGRQIVQMVYNLLWYIWTGHYKVDSDCKYNVGVSVFVDGECSPSVINYGWNFFRLLQSANVW